MTRGGKSVSAPVPWESLVNTVSSAPDPEALILRANVRETLGRALRLLSDEEREALLLFAIGGYRYGEIADIMELPLALVRKRLYTARQRLHEVEELAALRPSRDPEFEQRVVRQMQERVRLRKEREMSKSMVGPYTVDLLGPGDEGKIAVKNLYAFYRYELLMNHHYEPEMTPPLGVTEETWRFGAWVNRSGVIDGLHSISHEEATEAEDAFWEWPNLQAYLIQMNGWPAGFAFVASPPNATKGVDYRLQEFFILNKARRIGVGSASARLLFDRLPGRWELSYDPQRLPATAFWQKFLPEYTNGDFTEEMIGMGSHPDMPGYVFTNGPRPQHPIKVR